MEVSVRELKSRLSEYLRKVAEGKEIVVTSRGVEVARLLPPDPAQRTASTESEAIARFRSLPWVRPGRDDRPAPPKAALRIRTGEQTLAEIVSEQRG